MGNNVMNDQNKYKQFARENRRRLFRMTVWEEAAQKVEKRLKDFLNRKIRILSSMKEGTKDYNLLMLMRTQQNETSLLWQYGQIVLVEERYIQWLRRLILQERSIIVGIGKEWSYDNYFSYYFSDSYGITPQQTPAFRASHNFFSEIEKLVNLTYSLFGGILERIEREKNFIKRWQGATKSRSIFGIRFLPKSITINKFADELNRLIVLLQADAKYVEGYMQQLPAIRISIMEATKKFIVECQRENLEKIKRQNKEVDVLSDAITCARVMSKWAIAFADSTEQTIQPYSLLLPL